MPRRSSKAVIGSDRPRLRTKPAWGQWRISTDDKLLVCISDRAGNYQVSLTELTTVEECVARMQHVIADKSSWVDQRVLDDLRRALAEVTGFRIPSVPVGPR